jgi:hypothetical protein
MVSYPSFRKKKVMNLSDQSLIHHSSYDNMIILQYDKKINTADEFGFLDDFRKEYRPAEILARLRLKKSEYTWHIHSYVERGYCYGGERITLTLVRVRQISDDGTSTTHTVLPSFLLPYHVVGAHEIAAVIGGMPSSKDDEITMPETDEAPSDISSSFAYHIRRTMSALAHGAYLAVCQALSRGRKIFTLTT